MDFPGDICPGRMVYIGHNPQGCLMSMWSEFAETSAWEQQRRDGTHNPESWGQCIEHVACSRDGYSPSHHEIWLYFIFSTSFIRFSLASSVLKYSSWWKSQDAFSFSLHYTFRVYVVFQHLGSYWCQQLANRQFPVPPAFLLSLLYFSLPSCFLPTTTHIIHHQWALS